MLPLERPYKAIYSIVTFTYCFDEDRCAGTLDPAYTVHWVRILMSFFARHDAFPLAKEDVVRLLIARRCIEGVHHALNYYPSDSAVASSTTSLPEAGLFIDKVFDTFSGAQSCTAPTPLIGDCLAILKVKAFSVLFKAAEKGLLEWSAICEGTRLKDAVASFLLEDDRHDVRKGVANAVIDVCGRALNVSHAGDAVGDGDDDDDGVVGNGATTSSSENESTKVLDQIATSVWLIVADILANASEPPIPSEEFFDMAYKLFRSYVAKFPDQVELPRLLRQWGSILINYTPHEFVGREVPDNLVLGFLRLVRTCLEVTNSEAILEDTSQLLRPLFKTFLFPEFSDSAAEDVPEPTVPIMHEETREEIYKVFKFLCESPANYEVVMNELLGDIIPYDVTYESTAYADRTKLIRAPEGYAGLKNLSNTCYLNSLMTQLFMNVGFRKFILDAPMEGDADDADQALLFETKKLFSYLQDTWQKSVDPTDFVECIRTYDNESIDVTIQMDVDEFYNLLFDRWESQIKSEELKKSFKSIYGGQLVQQIKSKECGHVSERLEPFSAIQCDIKGKSSLEESLGAYVEGEIMQGDNKYLCSSCERHVDAVKRACLKEVPDNLIFHLKRFDFDMLMMLRNKINDEFQFPDRIDMTPYKAEYLNNPDEPIEPDMFELVGVLVHSGTAESGHYYSYIKERPLATDSTSGWAEFNDADVSRFHPSEIPNQCWGGRRDFNGNGQPLRYERAWNAYMLFYQRVSSMEEEQALFPRSPTKPAQVSLPPSLRNHIALENEIFMRTYCLMAPYHSAFVLGLLRQSRTFRNSRDESIPYAKLRKLAINVSLDHLEQLVARSKEQIDASGFLDELDLAIRESADNAVTILHWTNKRPNSIRNLLMRSYATIRIAFSRLIIACLTKLQSEIKDKSQSSSRLCFLRENLMGALEDIVAGLDRLWPNIHLFSKAWDNYFDLLIEIASFSNMGARLVLERSFLQRSMEVVLVHYEDSKRLKRSYLPYIRQLERGKNFSFIKLYELFLTLILYIDFTLPPSSDMLTREVVDGKFALTGIELDLLEYDGNIDEPLLIKRVIEQDDNKLVAKSLVELIADGASATQFEDGFQRIIAKGLSPPVRFPAPYLDAILTFCRVSPDQAKIVQLVDLAAYSTRNISDGGRQYIAFYQALMELNNVNIGRSVDWFSNLAIRRVAEWLPSLLCFPDLQVRRRALKFGEEHLIVTPEDESPEESLGVLRSICRNLCQQCLFKLRDCTTIVANTPAQFDGSQLEQLVQFIKLCLNAYYDKDNEEDAEIARDALG
ncbi:hypothetical protein KEM56_007756 [Ascosphaera pollenicola]|nr:hypothetical protein KEM56_007756 [Ascosphaera pollenicola]